MQPSFLIAIGAGLAILLIAVIFAGLYSGIFTVSEAASVAAVVSFVFALLRRTVMPTPGLRLVEPFAVDGLTAYEAATTLVRTSFSSVIRDFHDYACAIFDPSGRMLAQSTHSTPGLLGILPFTIPNFLGHAGFPAAKPGDVWITNDPWLASGHLIDITIATPVFRRGELVAYVLVVVHHLNIPCHTMVHNFVQIPIRPPPLPI